jgi:hypothetical protein
MIIELKIIGRSHSSLKTNLVLTDRQFSFGSIHETDGQSKADRQKA